MSHPDSYGFGWAKQFIAIILRCVEFSSAVRSMDGILQRIVFHILFKLLQHIHAVLMWLGFQHISQSHHILRASRPNSGELHSKDGGEHQQRQQERKRRTHESEEECQKLTRR